LNLELGHASELGRADQRVIAWAIEVDDKIYVDPELSREDFGIEGGILCAWRSVQPGKIRKGERRAGTIWLRDLRYERGRHENVRYEHGQEKPPNCTL
jgi:hypothetical protein